MNRDIKFRAWVDDKKMIGVRGMEFRPADARAYVFLERPVDRPYTSRSVYGGTPSNKVSRNRVKLMQFTGIRDNNNTDIYEGDVLRWGSYLGVVEWYQDTAQFQQNMINTTGSQAIHDQGLVIGNIYENPELPEAAS